MARHAAREGPAGPLGRHPEDWCALGPEPLPSLPEPQPLEPELAEVPPPAPDAGTPPRRLAIYLSRQAAAALGARLREATGPVAGLLLGYPALGPAGPFVAIHAIVTAPEVEPAGEGIRFPPSAWRALRAAWQQGFPGTWVVGWFRTRPGAGAAVSAHDQFTHHRFFPRPWQVCLVVDPVGQDAAFFVRDGPRLVPAPAFALYDASAWTPPAAAGPPPAAPRRERRRKGRRLRRKAALVALAIAAAATAWAVRLAWSARAPAPAPEQTLESAAAPAAPASLPAAAGASPPPPSPSQAAAGAASGPAAGKPAGGASARQGSLGRREAQEPEEASRRYVVQPGDTLWALSRRFLGDPRAYPRLAEANGIRNPRLIHPGRPLHIPAEPPAAGTP